MYISDFGDRFSFKSGSHYNRNENVLISIMLTISLSANKLRIAFTRSVEAETVDSVAQGRRTPFARRSLSFFQPKSLRALLLGLKEAPVRTSVVY